MSKHPPEVVDAAGNVVKLGAALGRGGEGIVYELPLRTDLVAKIYHGPLPRDRVAKIQAMVAIGGEKLSKLTAWPVGLLSQRGGNPIGLMMPKVMGRKDIHNLYSPKSRRSEFQRADWRFLIRTSANTARAFAAVHETGCVIGDVNHGGVLVGQDATVKLIDCDSFQVSHRGCLFPCTVGVETFTPPELQGKSFLNVVRSANHDNFGLAIIVFLMLFMGRHPFAGRYLGQGDMPIAKAIQEIRFPYGSRYQTVQMVRPPNTPPLSIVGLNISLLFERAFSKEAVNGGRPAAREWVAALEELEKELKQCSADPVHWHHRSSACPWCPMEGTTGIPLFSVLIQGSGDTTGFDIQAFWRQVEAVGHPGAAPSITSHIKIPSEKATAIRRKRKVGTLMAVLSALGLIFLAFAANLPVFFLLAVVAFVATKVMTNPRGDIAAIRKRREELSNRWNVVHREWESKAGTASFDRIKTSLWEVKSQWEALLGKKAAKLDNIKKNQRQLQLNQHLDRFQILNAKIDGIGSGRKQTLESFGIETALDITHGALQNVSGFGPKMQQRLLSWRSLIEQKFVFDPSRAIDPVEINKVENEHRIQKKALEARMEKWLADLREAFDQTTAARIQMRGSVERLCEELAQVNADLMAT